MPQRSRFYTELPQHATKTITFTAAGAGLNAAETAIFNVTGDVIVEYIVPFCLVDLTQAGATPTLALGVVGNTAIFLQGTTATAIDAGKFWLDTTPAEVGAIAVPAACKQIAITANIQCIVGGTSNIDAGSIRFDVYWRPLSSDGAVVAA